MNTYKLVLHNYDWGVSTDTAIVTLDTPITTPISKKDITVTELKENKTTKRTVRQVKQTEENELTLTLNVTRKTGSPFTQKGDINTNVWAKPYQLRITIKGTTVNPEPTAVETPADMFTKKEADIDGIHYDYATYSPEHKTETLFVWLHGLCEGQHADSNAYIPLLSHNGTILASKEFQKAVNYAHIFVPQCPTFWRDSNGEGNNADPGNRDSRSYYTKSLEKLIDQHATKIKAKKIILAGCSNGGFMCLNLAISRPDKYTAIVPVCEAMRDEALTDEDINKLKQVPMYFMYSKDDDTVIPETHEIPTIQRLMKAGAKDLHVSTSEHVTGIDQNNKPIKFGSHGAWVDFDKNNTNDGNGLSVWEWIGEKTN